MRTALILVALATFTLQPATALAQSGPLTARLVVPDDTVLPGVPFELWVLLRNTADTTLSVGLLPTLRVRPLGREEFSISATLADDIVLLRAATRDGGFPMRYATLRPGEEVTLTLPIDLGLRASSLFDEPRLLIPGQYTIALRLDAPADTELPLTYSGSVTTTEGCITRPVPTGTDAEVWDRMQELGKGHWTLPHLTTTGGEDANALQRAAIWAEIVAAYQDSNYLPYALIAEDGAGEAYLHNVIAALTRFPKSPMSELLNLKAWGLTAASCGLAPSMNAKVCERSWAALQSSKRPTTRLRVFGRVDQRRPCPPEYDCGS